MATLGPLTAGTTYRFEPIVGTVKGSLYKDGAVWNVTGLTVNLLLKQIDSATATTITVAATVTDATNGVCYADWVAGGQGSWSACWEVTGGGQDERVFPVRFTIVAAPAP